MKFVFKKPGAALLVACAAAAIAGLGAPAAYGAPAASETRPEEPPPPDGDGGRPGAPTPAAPATTTPAPAAPAPAGPAPEIAPPSPHAEAPAKLPPAPGLPGWGRPGAPALGPQIELDPSEGSDAGSAGPPGAAPDRGSARNPTMTLIDRVRGTVSKTTLGGYGEFAFTKYPGTDSTFEARRFVLFLFSPITDHITLATEVEWEHGGTPVRRDGQLGLGEVLLEFAVVDVKLWEPLTLRAGIILMPLGRLNVNHDAPSLELTDRPLVNTYIIPSTWWEAGAGLTGRIGLGSVLLSYELYAVNGLTSAISDGNGLRDARGSVLQDNNSDKALTGRLAAYYYRPRGRWTPTVEAGLSGYTGEYDRQKHRVHLVAGDLLVRNAYLEFAGEYVRAFIDAGRRFDAIILDPPKLAPTAAHAERAARAYKDINRLAFKLLAPGGVLFTYSCSGGISADLFHKIVAGAALDAGVDAEGGGQQRRVALRGRVGDRGGGQRLGLGPAGGDLERAGAGDVAGDTLDGGGEGAGGRGDDGRERVEVVAGGDVTEAADALAGVADRGRVAAQQHLGELVELDAAALEAGHAQIEDALGSLAALGSFAPLAALGSLPVAAFQPPFLGALAFFLLVIGLGVRGGPANLEVLQVEALARLDGQLFLQALFQRLQKLVIGGGQELADLRVDVDV
mgnify:CR=1 FL=1